MVARKSRGFVYLTSVAGVTGVRDTMPTYLPDFIQRVRSQSNVPLAVGFGISTPEQAQSIAAYADGVIIGSQLLRLIEADPSLNQLHQFVEQVRAQLNAGGNVG